MQSSDNVLPVLEKLSGAGSDSEVHGLLSTFAAKFGFERVTMTWICAVGLRKVVGEVPSTFLETFKRLRLDRYGPVTRRVRAAPTPFRWSDLATSPDGNPLEHRIMTLAAEAGLSAVLTVPIHSDGVAMGTVNFIGEAEISESDLHDLQVLAHAAHASMSLTRASSPLPALLTAREREVLKWMSMGKTTGDISQILSLSPRTVDFHLINASRKLDTLNRVHTVVEAIRRKEIQL